jgi:single-strand DNA-binding protein
VASYNRIVLVGNLTRDPQLSYTPANTAVCKFGIATNHKFKDRDGNMREEVCFVDCTVFGRGGETFNQYMGKGRTVLVEGRLHLNQWTTPEGDKRSKHEVVVDNFTFLGGPGGGGRAEVSEGGRKSETGGAPQGRGAPGPDDFEAPAPVVDDIPF